MYIVVVGAGKVGWNLARELIGKGNEVTVIESDASRFAMVEEELEHAVHYGDGSELWVLERAGVARADMVIAVTGDDEDNILICQVAREKYGVERVIARCNNPRNLQHIELLTRTSVLSLDTGSRVAKLSTQQEVSFDKALLATGANVRRLSVPGCDLDGIHYLRTLGNSVAIKEAAAEAD